MPQLSLFLLGPPFIERDGEQVAVDTRKAIALLAYLAVTHQRHSRDALATLLWPDYDQANARGTLRRTLSALNKALAGNWLYADREMIGLSGHASLRLDVDEFHKLLVESNAHDHTAAETCPACLDTLAKAVSLYRGDFMAGFSLRDSPNFDDWQFFQADSLRRVLAQALERLVQGYSTQGNFELALTYARRWLALDRLHEPAHHQLMLLYAWAGQRAPALHQYRECVQVLEQELGVSPLESTTQLYQSIKENRIPAPPVQQKTVTVTKKEEVEQAIEIIPSTSLPASTSVSKTAQQGNYPLVGRATEWERLLNAYNASLVGGHVIILEGEAGIGKTRLAEELLAYAHNRGATVITAHCYEGETQLAYGPFVSGMRTAIAQKPDASWLNTVPPVWISEAARLLPELVDLRPDVPIALSLDHPGAQGRFFEGLRHVLLALCKSSGSPSSFSSGLILFEDTHWADEASLELLTYLVRHLQEQPLCLLITWRTHHVAKDHHLPRLLNDAQRSGKASILPLTRLSREHVQQLAQVIAPDTTATFISRLYEEAEGLPFFLIEYLTAITKGVLAPESERWSLPGDVRDLLHSRLNSVGEIGWQLLATAAAIGRSFDFDTLHEASGRSEEETVSTLEELLALGLITEEQGATGETGPIYDFSHEKLRGLVYEESSLARRRLLHRRIAEVLVNRERLERGNRERGILPGQIAHHYQLAGNETLAAEYYKRAGERARSVYANKEALAHFRLALALGHPENAALHEAIGDLHTLMGQYSAALSSYETAAALSKPEFLPLLEHKLGNIYARRGEWELAESHLEAALIAFGENGPAGGRAKVYADWSLASYRHGQADAALELAQQALQLAEEGNDTQALAQVHNLLGILVSSRGETEQARHQLEQSLALAESLKDASIQAAALNNLALAYAASGEIEQALLLCSKALELCTTQGDRHREAALHSNMADMLHAAGRAEEAMLHLKQSVSIFAEIGIEAGTLQPEIWKLVEW